MSFQNKVENISSRFSIFWIHKSHEGEMEVSISHVCCYCVVASFVSDFVQPYCPGESIFQCPIFLSFHTVHGVLKARILKQFAIPFSSGPHFVRTLHHDPSVLGGPTQHGSHFH